MIQLSDKETGARLGAITEVQLQFLIDQLVEVDETDQDYYINPATLEMFADNGADAVLLDMLRKALGDRESMEIQWSRS